MVIITITSGDHCVKHCWTAEWEWGDFIWTSKAAPPSNTNTNTAPRWEK